MAFISRRDSCMSCDDYQTEYCVVVNGREIRFPVDNTDVLLALTTEPEKWYNEHPTIPIGQYDEQGHPLYKVVDLKPEFKKG